MRTAPRALLVGRVVPAVAGAIAALALLGGLVLLVTAAALL